LEKIWPEILEKNPNALLHICTYDFDSYIKLPDDVKKIHDEIQELLEYSCNIKKLENLPKKEFYNLLSNCAYMVYPTNFPEISCISAIEAQYNGCLVITSDKFAMSETVKSDTKVKSDEYGSTEYINKFLEYLDHYQDQTYENEVEK
jgi:glycosyltransferase involved in cell wall biosynthesis